MKNLTFSFIFLLFSALAYSQMTAEGVVIDKKTKEPLPFSTIRIIDKENVSIANDKGFFVLSYKDETNSNDTLQISCIGYYSLRLAITDARKCTLFALEEKSYLLSNIVVRPEIAADKLIEKVIKKFDDNFTKDAFEQEGFYRSTVSSDDKYAGITESFVKIYSDGHNKNFSDDKYQFLNSDLVKPLFCRHSKYTLRNDSRGFISKVHTPRGLLFAKKDLLYNAFLNTKNMKQYLYQYLDEKDNDYYVIAFTPKNNRISYKNSAFEQYFDNQIEGKLYIDKADLGVVKIETTNEKWSNSFQKITDKLTNHTHRFINKNVSMQFAKYNTTYYLTSINSESSYEDYGWNNSKHVVIKSKGELSISNLSSYKHSTEKLKEEYGYFRQSGDVKIQSKQSECLYDNSFWESVEKQLVFDYQQVRKDLGSQELFTNEDILTTNEIKEIINSYSPKGKTLYYEKNN